MRSNIIFFLMLIAASLAAQSGSTEVVGSESVLLFNAAISGGRRKVISIPYEVWQKQPKSKIWQTESEMTPHAAIRRVVEHFSSKGVNVEKEYRLESITLKSLGVRFAGNDQVDKFFYLVMLVAIPRANPTPSLSPLQAIAVLQTGEVYEENVVDAK